MTRPRTWLAVFLFALLACGLAAAVRPLATPRSVHDRPAARPQLIDAARR